jgi:hypothetical protein
MKLHFETWAHEQPIGDDAKNLVTEAATCFRAGAYRASLMFSYLSFQAVLRDRLKRSPAPNGFKDSRWADIQRSLHKEDEWDTAVFDATQQRTPPVFVLTEDVREEIKYWKNRRNDCAHGKDSRIAQPHVEAFWLFFESRLPRMVVSGSSNQLLKRVERHFDRSVTPPTADVLDIARDLPLSIEPNEVVSLLKEIEEVFDKNDDIFLPLTEDFNAFVVCAYEKAQPTLRKEILRFLELTPWRVRSLVEKSSQLAADLRGYDTLVRKLWYGEDEDHPARVSVLVALIAQGAIPADQVPEALARTMPTVSDDRLADEYLRILAPLGFDEAFRDYAFRLQKIDRFAWANANTRNVTDFIERNGIDADVAGAIWRTFDVKNHPHTLAEALKEYFVARPGRKAELEVRLQQLHMDWPSFLA